MTTFFPSLLSWSELSPLLIRLTTGAVFLYWAYGSMTSKAADPKDKVISTTEGIVGVLLVLGLWTQIVALAAVIDLVIRLIDKMRNRAFLTNGVNYYLILLVMALSLLLTGAGLIAFDLPV